MKYGATILLMLLIGLCAQAQKPPEYETINLTILKIERVREEMPEALWYSMKLTMRDPKGIIYKASTRCIATNPESSSSCAHIVMPRIAGTYAAKITAGGTLIYFGEISGQGFEIDSEEVAARADAK